MRKNVEKVVYLAALTFCAQAAVGSDALERVIPAQLTSPGYAAIEPNHGQPNFFPDNAQMADNRFQTLVGVFIGTQMQITPTLGVQVGLDGAASVTPQRLIQTVQREGSKKAATDLTYYLRNNGALFAEGKLLYTLSSKLQPYVLVAAGYSANELWAYKQDKSIGHHKEHTLSSPLYQLGVGLSCAFTSHWRLELGYSLMGLGDVMKPLLKELPSEDLGTLKDALLQPDYQHVLTARLSYVF